MTKTSDLDKLHTQFTKALAAGLKGETDADGNHIPPSAALLAVIGNFLSRSGVKATNDSPAMSTLRTAHDSLPFRTNADGSEIKAN